MAGTFAAAFVDAIKQKDPNRLTELASKYPARSQLTDLARAYLFSDQSAADRTVQWLACQPEIEPRPVAALRGFITQRFEVIYDGASLLGLIAANDNVRLDLIESGLAPADFALAA